MLRAETREAVAYLRVSTERQGRSGLGLEAQREAVARYARENGLTVAAEYLEVETGKGAKALSKRPQLVAALADAKRRKGKLVLAKLDRLARNVHFVSGLMESGIDFAVADMPHADPFRLHMEAVIAEDEARRISKRTKEALAAAKARGCKANGDPFKGGTLGSNGRVLAAKNKADALDALSSAAPVLRRMRESGLSMRKIVVELNEQGVKSPGNGRWHLANLDRALRRLNSCGDLPANNL